MKTNKQVTQEEQSNLNKDRKEQEETDQFDAIEQRAFELLRLLVMDNTLDMSWGQRVKQAWDMANQFDEYGKKGW